jgi:hypothetical protein
MLGFRDVEAVAGFCENIYELLGFVDMLTKF